MRMSARKTILCEDISIVKFSVFNAVGTVRYKQKITEEITLDDDINKCREVYFRFD